MKRRPVPWTRLAWVTWRQHRAALVAAAAVLGGFALVMLINGLLMRSTWHRLGLDTCRLPITDHCPTQVAAFKDKYGSLQDLNALLILPALIGPFLGGPLLAREFESGTFRFAWTQGTGRIRWLLTKLVLLAVPLTAAALAFGLLFSWWEAPFTTLSGRFRPGTGFDVTSVAFAGHILLGFALGVLTGAAIRRAVPALVTAIAAWFGVAYVTIFYLRQRYQAPVIQQVALTKGARLHGPGGGSWVLHGWFQDTVGHHVTGDRLAMQAKPQTEQQFAHWLTQHHYTQWISYQPVGRFWHFQLIEGGWMLAVSLLLCAAAIWLIRRRAA